MHIDIVNRKRVQRLMKLMGIRAVYPGSKNTSKPNKAHRRYPYLLSDIEINRSNQVWLYGYHVSPYGEGICLFGGDYGLAFKKSIELAHLECDGHRFLH